MCILYDVFCLADTNNVVSVFCKIVTGISAWNMGFCLPSGGINPLPTSNQISGDPISKVLTCIQIMTSYGVNLHHVYTHKCMLNIHIYIIYIYT